MPFSKLRSSFVLPLLAAAGLVTGGPMGTAGTARVLHVDHGSSFMLSLPRPHEAKLAVVTPNGEWIFLVDAGLKNPLLSEQAFATSAELQIDTRLLKGVRFVDGEERTVDVFTFPGKYTFVVSDNLETEPENMKSVSIVVEYGVSQQS